MISPARWQTTSAPRALIKRAPTVEDFAARLRTFAPHFKPADSERVWERYRRDALEGFVSTPTHIADLSSEVTGIAYAVCRAGWLSEDDVRLIGPAKPMGYTILGALDGRITPDAFAQETRRCGLGAYVWDGGLQRSDPQPIVAAPFLLAWHAETLTALLQANAGLLTASRWPLNAEAFARRVMTEHVETVLPLYDLISTAYADPRLFLPNVYAYATPPPAWSIQRASQMTPPTLGLP